jgi:adenosine deaminase
VQQIRQAQANALTVAFLSENEKAHIKARKLALAKPK